MPRKKVIVKEKAPIVRIRENSRLMQTHESMVDYLSGRAAIGSFVDIFTQSFIGLNSSKSLEDDLIYSDEDEEYDDEEEDDAADKALEPHPQIKQLTEEEADKFVKDLLKEDERRKDKTERNKRKKMRKKEKKRLKKESATEDNLPEEEEAKSDSLENQKESTIIESNPEPNEQENKSQNPVEAIGGDESKNNTEKTGKMKTENKGKMKTGKKDLDLQNSQASSVQSVPKEMCSQKPTEDQKGDKKKSPDVEQPKESKPAVEKPAIQKKEEKVDKEKTGDCSLDALAKKSREFANMGNRLAASGQFEMAVKCFTDAIKYNPKEFKLFGNRSLCYERIQQHENALQDADVALSMEPNWIKGLFRKGKALCGLKRYYEASLIYQQVLKLESTSSEAAQELKRAQTLHLMELGFSWSQSSEALKAHATLQEATDALFKANRFPPPHVEPSALQDGYDGGAAGWPVVQSRHPRTHQIRESGEQQSTSQSPTRHSRKSDKPQLFAIWVGTLSPAVTYTRLHELFSRTGTVYNIKMLLEQQCAFVNYTKREDCDRAIRHLNGMLVDGAPLTVRYPFKSHTEAGATDSATRPGTYKKECFFWRTGGCTRQDCTFRHVPENKNIDRERFTWANGMRLDPDAAGLPVGRTGSVERPGGAGKF